jgi:hypothetical protein
MTSLISSGHVPASRSSSRRSLSRLAAASFPACTAWRQFTARLEVGRAVGDPGGEAGDLLHGPRDRQADGANRRVDAVRRVDGAVRDPVDLVELPIHAVHAASDLADHREERLLGSPDERRKLRDGSGQPDEEERRGDPTASRKTASASRQRSPHVNAAASILGRS